VNESRIISFDEAGRLLGELHPKALRERKGGTENLTHVSGFGRRGPSNPRRGGDFSQIEDHSDARGRA